MPELLQKAILKMAPVSSQELDHILSHFREQIIPRKEYVLRSGQVCRLLTYCEKGCFRNYYVNDEGEEIVVDFAIEDYWVGDLYSLINNVPSKYNLQALEDSLVYSISISDFRKLCEEIPKLQEGYLFKAQRNNNNAVDLLALQKYASAEEKYSNMLQRFPGIANRVAANYIASYLGIQPASLSRLKKKIAGG